MNCPSCGAACPRAAAYCPRCGASLASAAEPFAHIRTSELVRLSGSALKWGIMGLAFGATPSVSVLGIVFSAISMRYARRYARRNGRLNGRARVAHRMAMTGLIAGIALTAVQIVLLLLAARRGWLIHPPLPGGTLI